MTDKNTSYVDIYRKAVSYLPPVVISIIFITAYAIVFYNSPALFNDPDAAWHIITGDLVRKLGHLPDTNTWSFIVPYEKWYLVSWLWDVMVSIIHQLGGTVAVFIFAQTLIALIIALVAYHISIRGNISSAVIIIITIMLAICFRRFVVSRPQIIGYLFIVFYHLRLHKSREDANFKNLAWLPPIMLLWVNMHGSFFTGFVLIGTYGLEALLTKQWRWLMRLCIIGAACLVLAFVNPYGFGMYDAVNHTLGGVMPQYIEEWTSFKFGVDWGVSRWLVLFLFLSNFRETTIPLADRMLSAMWLLPVLGSVRHASIFMLVSAPYLAINLQRSIEYIKGNRSVKIIDKMSGMQFSLLRPVFLVAAIAVVAVSANNPNKYREESDLISTWFDSRPAIDWMNKYLTGKRVLNDYDYGGIIIYQTKGTFPVFVDGRAGTAYPEELLSDYERFEHFYKDWEKVPDKYRVDAILIDNHHPFATRYVEGARYNGWRLVYTDPVASIFARNGVIIPDFTSTNPLLKTPDQKEDCLPNTPGKSEMKK